jgi:hypothetical protein
MRGQGAKKMNSDVECTQGRKGTCLSVFCFIFIFESGPLNYFLPHVIHLDNKLEEMEDNQMEVISTHFRSAAMNMLH